MYVHGLLETKAKYFFFIQQLRAVSVERGGRLGISPYPCISWQLTALLNSWGAWKNISRQCFTHIHVYTLTHSQLTRQWTSHSSLYKEKISKNKCIWTRAVTINWLKKWISIFELIFWMDDSMTNTFLKVTCRQRVVKQCNQRTVFEADTTFKRTALFW